MRNFLKRFAVGIGLVAVLLAVAAYLVHRSMQTGPAFYQEALLIDASAGSAAGEQLEQQLVELHNEVLREEQWSATFTEEQINGWLAYGLPKRFAHVLPSTVSDPRCHRQRRSQAGVSLPGRTYFRHYHAPFGCLRR